MDLNIAGDTWEAVGIKGPLGDVDVGEDREDLVGIGALVRNDDGLEELWVVADVPYDEECKRGLWESRVLQNAQNCSLSPSPPVPYGMKPGKSEHFSKRCARQEGEY